MKKYKATKENPIFKKGTKFKYDGDGSPTYMSGHGIDINLLYKWMEKGYIKEVQKKEFTKDDMLEFARFYHSRNFVEKGIEIIKKWQTAEK